MLWIGGQITAIEIMKGLFLPSLINLLIPLAVTSRILGDRPVIAPVRGAEDATFETSAFERNLMFYLGLSILVLVPVFKTVTHLPPFMGILFGLGVLWLVGDLVHRQTEDLRKQRLTLVRALTRIDMSSIVFFIGILLSVAVLEHTHILSSIAQWLDKTVGRQDVIVILIGLVSAVVDNVPLVAASMGMYSLEQYPVDSFFWEFLAYCAGTGGSILIIGSAAGVAAMGLEKIDFIWYLKKISGLAFLGYAAGAAFYIAEHALFY
jgi:Na+/H+ antiporter NhaD/arsenite permease-like protein